MYWLTEIEATNPDTNELCTWAGPRISAETEEEARQICIMTGMGYCKVLGKFIEDIAIIETNICPN